MGARGGQKPSLDHKMNLGGFCAKLPKFSNNSAKPGQWAIIGLISIITDTWWIRAIMTSASDFTNEESTLNVMTKFVITLTSALPLASNHEPEIRGLLNVYRI